MRPTIQLFLFLLAFTVSSVGYSQSETRDFNEFDAVRAAGNIELVLIPDSKNYADIQVKNTDIDNLEIELEGSTLKFNLKGKGFWGIFGGGNGKARIKLHYSEELRSIVSSAAADISSNDLVRSTDELRLNSSSGSGINLEIECDKLKAGVSSGADIDITGIANYQKISVSSGGTYESKEVNSKEAVVKASSGGHIAVWVDEKLEGKASSGASIHYHGNPKRTDVSSSSGGSIKSK